MDTKECYACRRVKPLDEFHRSTRNRDGHQGRCKACSANYSRTHPYPGARTAAPGETKRCGKCKTEKATTDFFSNRRTKDGLNNYCKPCWTAYTLAREAPEERARRQRAWWLKRFGMTLDGYDAMHEAQGRCCAICKGQCSTGKRLAVDHDAETGRVRGLLCVRCNQGIGRFEHNPEMLKSAAAYLESVPQLTQT